MRTSISVPDEYYNKIKQQLQSWGFVSFNDFILDLIRHKLEDGRELQKSSGGAVGGNGNYPQGGYGGNGACGGNKNTP